MTARVHVVILSAISLVVPPTVRGQEAVVPAGTILQCTISERNLSSKTTETGDPVLCDAGPIYVFGVPVLPRGAYLEGHFSDFRNPGHFWGKGWMQLDFDRILLPGAEIPLSTKVTSVPHLPVDAQGTIHGTGHAKRDAVEWAIPVLWPWKVITLPMRGPRPTLKGSETRVTLKLMQDLPIPQEAAGFPSDRRLLKPGAFRPGPRGMAPGLHNAVSIMPSDATSAWANPPLATTSTWTDPPLAATSPEGTALILRGGGDLLVKNYWFEDGQRIRYHALDGSEGVLPIRALDFGATVKVNRRYGVEFMVSTDAGASNGGN